MPAGKKKARKANIQEELLRQILAELQALNANLAACKAGPQIAQARAPSDDSDDSGDEELEEYE